MVDEKALRDAVGKIVSQDDVKYVVGYKKGTYGFQVKPAFAYTTEDAKDFIFSPLCANNLSVYPMLEEKPPLPRGEKPDDRKIGVVVKGCDSKAIVQIIQENGLRRDDIVIIGVPCSGVIDPKKMKDRFPKEFSSYDIKEKNDNFIVTIDGNSHTVKKDELIFNKCKHCENPNPIIHDVLIGKEIPSKKREDYQDIKKLEKKSLKDKWKYWEEQFDRCIRCYACRNICPLCYCKECMVDELTPQWIRRSTNISENTSWNIMRAFHLAGRCIGCGECERACPMDIPLMELNKKIEKDIREIYEYSAGKDPEAKPLLATFNPNDPEEFIL